MELLLLAPGAITSCLLLWLLERATSRLHETGIAHTSQLERLAEAHRKEVADLCQRIQAPTLATGAHASQGHVDPAGYDLEDDEILKEINDREQALRQLERDIQARAEEMAVER